MQSGSLLAARSSTSLEWISVHIVPTALLGSDPTLYNPQYERTPRCVAAPPRHPSDSTISIRALGVVFLAPMAAPIPAAPPPTTITSYGWSSRGLCGMAFAGLLAPLVMPPSPFSCLGNMLALSSFQPLNIHKES